MQINLYVDNIQQWCILVLSLVKCRDRALHVLGGQITANMYESN